MLVKRPNWVDPAVGVAFSNVRTDYPVASSRAVTAVMKGNRKRDTLPEVRLRSALHRAGLRFRKDYPVRPDAGRLIRVDIAFPAARVAVFVDGCFWHSCPSHGNTPVANAAYWQPKLARNVERDRENDTRLSLDGWKIVHVWEHETPEVSVLRVFRTLKRDDDTERNSHR